MSEPVTDGADASPRCFRHPDRETYVRCTRCDRPICPDCMNDAAVGFQCPDCVKAGNKSMRERRTVFGGRVGADGTLTKALIGINVAAFLVEQSAPRFFFDYAMISAYVADGDYYRLLSSAFLHANLLHIAFNMYALFLFGTSVEQALGRVRYLSLYVLSALGGSVLSYLVHAPYTTGPDGAPQLFAGVGASGAIFGLFGAYFVIARRLRADTSHVAGLIAINLFFGVAVPNIDNWAHIGGLLTGGALAFALAKAPRNYRDRVQAIAFLLVAIVLIAAAAVRTSVIQQDYPLLTVGAPRATAAAPR